MYKHDGLYMGLVHRLNDKFVSPTFFQGLTFDILFNFFKVYPLHKRIDVSSLTFFQMILVEHGRIIYWYI